MSERMTSIHIPGIFGAGYAVNNREDAATMIKNIRAYANHLKQTADAILAADDSDFRIETYIGPYARKNLEIIQEGRK